LLIGLLVGFLMTATSVVVGYLAYYEVARAFNEASRDAGIARGLAVTLNDAVVAEVLHTRSYIIASDAESLTLRDLAAQDFERAYAELQASLAGLQAGLVSLPESATVTLQELRDLQREYDALADEIIPLLGSGQTEAAVSLFDERSDTVVLRLLAAKRNLREDINAWEDQAERDYFVRTSQVVLITAFIFLLGAIVSGLFVMRLLASPISALNYFEHALIETAENGASHPTQLPRSLPVQNSAVFQAYNALVARLRESEASRLDFMAKVIHSFRSPLASIAGYAELMSNPALRPVDADLEGYARVISKQAARLGQMVEQVVTAVRIDDRQLDLTLAPVRLGPLLAEVVAEAKNRSRREIAFDDQLTPAIIACDALYIRQIFWNLIDNAVKFSPPNTPVQVTLRQAPAPGRAEVAVTDQGIGIAEADQPTLFTRFGRIHNQRTRGLSGSGLGLYIAKYIVDQHFGDITVHSQPGQGATFVVTLPVENGLS
jgi:signal transduction histidine kinase